MPLTTAEIAVPEDAISVLSTSARPLKRWRNLSRLDWKIREFNRLMSIICAMHKT